MVLHSRIIQIPALFRFQPFEADWILSSAEIRGWAEDAANVPSSKSRPRSRGLDSANEQYVTVDIPVSNTGLGIWLGETVAVQIKRSTIPRTVLLPHETKITTPDIEGRLFEVLICRNEKFAAPFQQEPQSPAIKDAWKMRTAFLDLKRDPHLLCEFLNKWGLWSSDYGYRVETLQRIPASRPPQPRRPFVLEFPERLWEAGETYKRALLPRNGTAWIKQSGAVEFTKVETPPFFAVERSYIDTTIATTITIDHMRKARFGICKNEKCSRLFEHETQHRKQFCSRNCISAAGIRNWREKKKKAAAKE